MELDGLFDGYPQSRQLFDVLRGVIEALGGVEMRVTKSQVAFRRQKAFAWAWIPGRTLRGRNLAPLVLTLALRRRHPSPRWKQVVEPYPGRFTHHLELHAPGEIDAEVRAWIEEAWLGA